MDRHKLIKDIFGDDWTDDIPDSTIINSVLKTLTEREQQALELRYSGMTYQQIGDLMQYITRERVRQILNKALWKLKHPSRWSGSFKDKMTMGQSKNIRVRKRFKMCEELELLDINLSEFKFSVRVSNCFRDAGISTLGELASKTDTELLHIRNFGRKSFNEVKQFFDELEERVRS